MPPKLKQWTDVGDAARNGRGRSRKWARQERSSARALTAFKIAIAGRHAILARLQLIAVHCQAHAASRLAPLRACFNEDAGKAFLLGLFLYLLRARHNQHARLRIHLAAFQYT